MPIPSPNSGEERNEFISRCIGELYDEYGQEQAAGICYSVADKEELSVQEFASGKFAYPPNNKEKMPDFMSRCMSNEIVRKKYSNRVSRVGFCYSEFQTRYKYSIGKNWK